MQLTNFTPSGQNPAAPAGPAELGGIPVHVFLERSDPTRAWITIRSSMAEGAQLVPRLQAVTEISAAGGSVAVRVAPLKCGATALQGQLDPALAEALAGPLPVPADPDPAPTVPEPAPEAARPDARGSLAELSRRYDEAKAQSGRQAEGAGRLRAEAAELRERLAAIEAELSEFDTAAAGSAERRAELRQQIRDLLDAEEE